ncbi:MAG: dTDP-glucose 4,6-dehydratase [Candidatus Aenigmarchaeota archaeon]|nr:dTDP-glucose 4,6-dehydratase [Candidatus Aenigmarchaeota archaeon]
MKVLVTGGVGFIGSNFVKLMVNKYPDYKITVLDKLTYAGNKDNLRGTMDKIKFVQGDICDKNISDKLVEDADIVVHFAAETHVDRSIMDAGSFVLTDVFGTYRLMDAAKKFGVEKFVHISTDEVYGQILEGSFKETDKLDPRNPYSASKAGAELLANSFRVTHDVPVIITRSSNNFGPYQHPEKMIPRFILNALKGEKLPLYGKGENVRDWIYVMDNCRAIDTVMERGEIGEIYNVGGDNEKMNIDVTKLILKYLGKDESLIEFVKDRLGHDFRYSLESNKIKQLGWKPKNNFEDSLKKTIDWYKENEWWWKSIKY